MEEVEKDEKDKNQNSSIKKYMYLGDSPNLIEYFAIIGYSQSYISSLVDSFQNINSSPIILSSIISNNNYELQNDEDIIINRIYPSIPKIKKESDPRQISSIVFSSYFEKKRKDGKKAKKIYYTCFAYKFYEKYIHKDKREYYIPKTFCILSQYPYFRTFFYICNNIYYKKMLKIPMELLIYSIVNYMPSPINYSLNFNFFSNKDVIKAPRLAGYPIIDFNLIKIIFIFPKNLVVILFLAIFLEQKLILFSPSYQLLNILVYTLHILNFPFNNNSYHNNIGSSIRYSSKDIYSYETNNGKEASFHIKFYLDSQKIELHFDDDKDEARDLFNYIESILLKTTDKKTLFLEKFISNLIDKLTNIIKEVQEIDNNKIFEPCNEALDKINKSIQEIFYDFILNFFVLFYYDNVYSIENNKIEENKEKNHLVKLSKILDIKDQNLSKVEKTFIKLFRETLKYKLFFIEFLRNFEVEDKFKINYILFKEFIQIKLKNREFIINNSIPYFKIYDDLYFQADIKFIEKSITFSQLDEKYKENIIDIKNKISGYLIKDKNNNEEAILNFNKNILYEIIYYFKQCNKETLNSLFPSIKEIEKNVISEIDIEKLYEFINNELIKYKLIPVYEIFYYSIIIFYLLTFRIFNSCNLINRFKQFIKLLEEIQFNDLYYITLIAKIFQKYNEIKQLEDINLAFQDIRKLLRKKYLIPNKELIDILDKFDNNGLIINEENNIVENGDNTMKYIFTIYSKYNFAHGGMITVDKILKNNMLISYESYFLNISVSEKKNFTPKIIMKISNNEQIYQSNFYSFLYLLNTSRIMLNDSLLNNLELKKINKLSLINLILNVIQYGKYISKASKKIPSKIIHIYYFIEAILKLHILKTDNENVINDENDMNVKKEDYNNFEIC